MKRMNWKREKEKRKRKKKSQKETEITKGFSGFSKTSESCIRKTRKEIRKEMGDFG
jgi:hypothetical protein